MSRDDHEDLKDLSDINTRAVARRRKPDPAVHPEIDPDPPVEPAGGASLPARFQPPFTARNISVKDSEGRLVCLCQGTTALRDRQTTAQTIADLLNQRLGT